MNNKSTNFLIKSVVGILFLVLVFIIIEDPLHIFDIFDNPGRIQLYVIFALVIILNILYLVLYKIKLKIYHIVIYIIGCIIMCTIFYFMTIPSDNDKNIKTIDEFKSTMEFHDFSITKENMIEKLEVYDSTVYLAAKDDINFYYIINDNKRTINKIYEELNKSSFSDCTSGGQGSISGDYIERKCENPSYLRIGSKIKNTMIYTESKLESKDNVETILYRLGYNR